MLTRRSSSLRPAWLPFDFVWGQPGISVDGDLASDCRQLPPRPPAPGWRCIGRLVRPATLWAGTAAVSTSQMPSGVHSAGKRAFAFDDLDHGVLHVGAGRAEGIFRHGRNRSHLSDHRENVFLELLFIPQHDPQRVRGDVGDLNQTAIARGKLLARIVSPEPFRPTCPPRAAWIGSPEWPHPWQPPRPDSHHRSTGEAEAPRSSRAPSACASCRRRARSCRSCSHFIFASCITISQIVLHFSTRWRVRLFEFLPSELQLDALAIVMVHDGRPLAARKLDFRGERAALEILITLQIEQRIFAMLLDRIPPPP